MLPKERIMSYMETKRKKVKVFRMWFSKIDVLLNSKEPCHCAFCKKEIFPSSAKKVKKEKMIIYACCFNCFYEETEKNSEMFDLAWTVLGLDRRP